MSGFHGFELDELMKEQADRSGPYYEFLRRPAVSMGLYVLAAGGEDLQHPHDADEIYVVLQGHATLRVDGTEQEVRAGSVISVDRGVGHNFADITEDLHILVVFAPPESPEG
jgi:quercetin dioxygenase-like cupin family protein